MLYVYSNIKDFRNNFESFKKDHKDGVFIDLSKHPLCDLATQCDHIVSHHSKCSVFLGHIEPGWMITLQDQTRIRKLLRKFPVGLVTKFVDSIPHSWKNEIDIYYTQDPLNKNGNTNSVNDGSTLQD